MFAVSCFKNNKKVVLVTRTWLPKCYWHDIVHSTWWHPEQSWLKHEFHHLNHHMPKRILSTWNADSVFITVARPAVNCCRWVILSIPQQLWQQWQTADSTLSDILFVLATQLANWTTTYFVLWLEQFHPLGCFLLDITSCRYFIKGTWCCCVGVMVD